MAKHLADFVVAVGKNIAFFLPFSAASRQPVATSRTSTKSATAFDAGRKPSLNIISLPAVPGNFPCRQGAENSRRMDNHRIQPLLYHIKHRSGRFRLGFGIAAEHFLFRKIRYFLHNPKASVFRNGMDRAHVKPDVLHAFSDTARLLSSFHSTFTS